MKNLNYDLMKRCKAHNAGSASTKSNRFTALQLMADQLADLGYKLPSAASLKTKHVQALVDLWRKADLTDGTIANRMAHLRWWAEDVGKAGMIAPDNKAYGIAPRTKGASDRAQSLTDAVLNKVSCPHVGQSLRLMAAFGLRREEAMKLRPLAADKGTVLVLRGSWCKGGRPREIPIRTDEQRALLDAVKLTAGRGSLIPTSQTYVEHMKAFEHQTLSAGLGNTHALRHDYAQRRYAVLTGWPAPISGGPAYATLTRQQQDVDRRARLLVSQELGHARIEITNAYLGPRR